MSRLVTEETKNHILMFINIVAEGYKLHLYYEDNNIITQGSVV